MIFQVDQMIPIPQRTPGWEIQEWDAAVVFRVKR